MPALPIQDFASLLSRAVTTTHGSSRVSSTARTGRRVITAGAIAGIVIGAVALIAFLVIAICIFRRHKRTRARHAQEMNKYYGDGRSNIGTNPPPAQDYNNAAPGMAQPYGYGQGQGQGYGYAHTAAPGQHGYGALPAAHTADHVHSGQMR